MQNDPKALDAARMLVKHIRQAPDDWDRTERLCARALELAALHSQMGLALEAAQAEVATLKAVLTPFANLDWMLSGDDKDDEEFIRHDGTMVTVGEVRRARAALTDRTKP